LAEEVVDPLIGRMGGGYDADSLTDDFAAILARVFTQRGAIDSGEIEELHRRAIALAPMTDEFRVKRTRPAHATFQEREAQSGESTGHPAQDMRLRGAARARVICVCPQPSSI